MVGFGRICYADIPDLKDIFWAAHEAEEGGRGKGATDGEREADLWEKELVRAGGAYRIGSARSTTTNFVC